MDKIIVILCMCLLLSGCAISNPVAKHYLHSRGLSDFSLSEAEIEKNKQEIQEVGDTYFLLGKKKDYASIYTDVMSYEVQSASSIDKFVELANQYPQTLLDYEIFNITQTSLTTATAKAYFNVLDSAQHKICRAGNLHFSKENPPTKKQDENGVWKLYALEIDEKLTAYLTNQPDLSGRIKKAIVNKVIIIGMSKDDVRLSWGEPKDINKTVGAWGVHEQWVYGYFPHNTYIYFENGVLTSWQEYTP